MTPRYTVAVSDATGLRYQAGEATFHAALLHVVEVARRYPPDVQIAVADDEGALPLRQAAMVREAVATVRRVLGARAA